MKKGRRKEKVLTAGLSDGIKGGKTDSQNLLVIFLSRGQIFFFSRRTNEINALPFVESTQSLSNKFPATIPSSTKISERKIRIYFYILNMHCLSLEWYENKSHLTKSFEEKKKLVEDAVILLISSIITVSTSANAEEFSWENKHSYQRLITEKQCITLQLALLMYHKIYSEHGGATEKKIL